MRDATDLASVAAAMAALDHRQPYVDEATRRVTVAVDAGTDQLRDALRSLDATGAAVDGISLRPRPSTRSSWR